MSLLKSDGKPGGSRAGIASRRLQLWNQGPLRQLSEVMNRRCEEELVMGTGRSA
jgi:hypothetical protein